MATKSWFSLSEFLLLFFFFRRHYQSKSLMETLLRLFISCHISLSSFHFYSLLLLLYVCILSTFVPLQFWFFLLNKLNKIHRSAMLFWKDRYKWGSEKFQHQIRWLQTHHEAHQDMGQHKTKGGNQPSSSSIYKLPKLMNFWSCKAHRFCLVYEMCSINNAGLTTGTCTALLHSTLLLCSNQVIICAFKHNSLFMNRNVCGGHLLSCHYI